jgi:hypothetical protein
MPETPVNKDNRSPFGHDDIGFAGKALAVQAKAEPKAM